MAASKGKAAPCLGFSRAGRARNFFRRARGSRLGYPWLFTPTVVPEADRASRRTEGREAWSASYPEEPALLVHADFRELRFSQAGTWTTWRGNPANARARRDVAAGPGPPLAGLGPSADLPWPTWAARLPAAVFIPPSWRSNHRTWGSGHDRSPHFPTPRLLGSATRAYK